MNLLQQTGRFIEDMSLSPTISISTHLQLSLPLAHILRLHPARQETHAYATIGEEALWLSSSIDEQKSWHGVKAASLARYHYRRRRQRWRNKNKWPCSVATPRSVDVDVDGRLQQKCSSRGGVVRM